MYNDLLLATSNLCHNDGDVSPLFLQKVLYRFIPIPVPWKRKKRQSNMKRRQNLLSTIPISAATHLFRKSEFLLDAAAVCLQSVVRNVDVTIDRFIMTE